MDLGSFYISLLILKGLTMQQAQAYSFCAQTSDPVACYDSIPDRQEMQESYIYGDYELPPQYTQGQFYHYVNPLPLTHTAPHPPVTPRPPLRTAGKSTPDHRQMSFLWLSLSR